MSARLSYFDYTRPFFYMVTLTRERGYAPFCQIIDAPHQHYLEKNALTHAFLSILTTFHKVWPCIEPITRFAIMPDHIHCIIKIKPIHQRKSLPILVHQLKRTLERAYFTLFPPQKTTLTPHLFTATWHDWIIKKEGQLATFTRYIRENPKRHWLRHAHPEHFGSVKTVSFLTRQWYAYGNLALLEAPVLMPFQCSRKWQATSPEWKHATTLASRLGPGCAGISTFMSPCEKACGNLIYKTGGSLILLSPEGMGERWHPPREKENLCAQGRLLYLSLYPASASKPDRATLYTRCHAMGDLVKTSLQPPPLMPTAQHGPQNP